MTMSITDPTSIIDDNVSSARLLPLAVASVGTLGSKRQATPTGLAVGT